MLFSCNVAAGPTPETMRSWGDWKAPAETMTSFVAERMKVMPPRLPISISTPVAVLVSSKMIRLAKVDW